MRKVLVGVSDAGEVVGIEEGKEAVQNQVNQI